MSQLLVMHTFQCIQPGTGRKLYRQLLVMYTFQCIQLQAENSIDNFVSCTPFNAFKHIYNTMSTMPPFTVFSTDRNLWHNFLSCTPFNAFKHIYNTMSTMPPFTVFSTDRNLWHNFLSCTPFNVFSYRQNTLIDNFLSCTSFNAFKHIYNTMSTMPPFNVFSTDINRMAQLLVMYTFQCIQHRQKTVSQLLVMYTFQCIQHRQKTNVTTSCHVHLSMYSAQTENSIDNVLYTFQCIQHRQKTLSITFCAPFNVFSTGKKLYR